jgi:DNA-binding transcriptional LysR family regulator
LLREGIGWGNMPVPMIQADLFSGALVQLPIPDNPGGTYRFSGIYRRDAPPGPATTWLLQQFVDSGREDAEPVLGDI